MRPTEIKKALELLVPLGQPAFVWGAPGVGKSQIVAQTARLLGRELVDLRAVLLDPVDLRGIPKIGQDDVARWCPPSFLPRCGSGILFLDELNAAPPLVQAACYQLVLDRKLGEYELPAGWTVVAAGNRESDRAVTHRMPSALANRFVHLDFEPSVEDWIAWAQQENMPEELVAFIRFRPSLLHSFDPSGPEKAFPSPRTWEYAGRIVQSRPEEALEYALLKGTVGEGAAAEFTGFCRLCRDLPEPEAVLAAPDSAPVPEEPAVLYALCEALARAMNPATMDGLVRYASRLPAEFGVLLVRGAAARDKAVLDSGAFTRWATANAQVLF